MSTETEARLFASTMVTEIQEIRQLAIKSGGHLRAGSAARESLGIIAARLRGLLNRIASADIASRPGGEA
jgi:hypothetical protein